MQKILLTEQDTKKFAIEIAYTLKQGDILLLHGNLGIGKTFFTRHLIQELTRSTQDIPSPTFNILQTYQSNLCEISHYDFYRINDTEELFELDIDNALNNHITIIEWPEILEEYIDKKFHPTHIYFSFQDNKRCVIVKR